MMMMMMIVQRVTERSTPLIAMTALAPTEGLHDVREITAFGMHVYTVSESNCTHKQDLAMSPSQMVPVHCMYLCMH